MDNKHLSNFMGGGFAQVSWRMIKVLGIKEALFIVCLWDHRTRLIESGIIGEDDYFFVTQEDIQEKTTLHTRLQYDFLQKFIGLGFILSQRRGAPPKNFYYIDSMRLLEYIDNQLQNVILSSDEKSELNQTKSLNHIYNTEIINTETRSSKEDLGAEAPSVTNSTKIYRPPTDPFVPYSEVGKSLFLHWNSLGKPVQHHRIDSKSKSFKDAMRELDRLLKKQYTASQIKGAMDNYQWLLTEVGSKLVRPSKGKSSLVGECVSLIDFLVFPEYLRLQITKFNPPVAEISSWFIECLKSRDELQHKWFRLIKDEYPKVTKELKRLWADYTDKSVTTVDDENIFRNIAKKAYNYFVGIQYKYNWDIGESSVESKLHYMFECLQAEGQDFRFMKAIYLLSDKMYTERLPMHWNRIALCETESLTRFDPKQERDDRELREYREHFGVSQHGTRAETLARIAAEQSVSK